MRRATVPAHRSRRRADRTWAAHSAEGAGVAGEQRSACQRRAHFGGHADWQGAHRQPALNGTSAGEHALSSGSRNDTRSFSWRCGKGKGAQLETWLEDGSVDLAILYRTSASPKNGDTYLVETSTYLVSAAGDPLTSRPTVRFSALHNLPLVLFCRPSSWRNHLEQISAERGVSLNVVLGGRFAQPANAYRL